MRSTETVEARAVALGARGFSAFDALHVAFAEASRSNWFLTCDDRLLRSLRRLRPAAVFVPANPVEFLRKGTP